MIRFVCDKSGVRLDKYLAVVSGNSRSEMERYIDEGRVFVNGVLEKRSYKVEIGDIITYEEKEAVSLEILPEDIPLDIIYEDKNIIAINKPKGMIVHPSGNILSGTLVNALMFYTHDLSDINGVLRPGIVHRLDKDTSGIILIAKDKKSHLSLAKQFQERSVAKVYLALVYGGFKESKGEVVIPILRSKRDRKKMAVDKNGRYAKTLYEVIEGFQKYSLLRINIITGRTHQIRVHMSHIGHPVVGDEVYSKRKNEFGVKGQLLHAHSISFCHPVDERMMTISCDPPEDFRSVISILKKEP